MSNLKANELVALRKLKEALTRDFQLVELRLFGSKARGDSDPESDIDVLVVLRECDWQTKRKVFDLCFDIGLENDVLLSPIVYSRSRFQSGLTRVTPFYQNVEREGVTVQ